MACSASPEWHPAAMRTRLVLLTVVLAMAVAPAAAQAALPRSVTCTGSAATVLFWPKGHKYVPGVRFPAIPTPHLEVYRPGAAYPATNFLLYADAKRFVDPSNTCGTAPVTATRAVRNRRTITVKKAITCNAASNLAYDVLRSKKGLTIIGHVGPEAYFRAEIKPNGSKLTYDRSACRAAAAPR